MAQIFIPDAPEASSFAAPGGGASSRPEGRASTPDSLSRQYRTDAAAVAQASAEPGAASGRGAEDAEAMPEWWNPSPALHVSQAYKQEVLGPSTLLCLDARAQHKRQRA